MKPVITLKRNLLVVGQKTAMQAPSMTDWLQCEQCEVGHSGAARQDNQVISHMYLTSPSSASAYTYPSPCKIKPSSLI